MWRRYEATLLWRFRCTCQNNTKHDQHDRGFFFYEHGSETPVIKKIKLNNSWLDVGLSNTTFLAQHPSVGQGLLIHEVSRSHMTTHHSRYDSFGRVKSSSQRPLPDYTQHSEQRDTHAPAGIRTHNLSRRAATDPRLRPRGNWARHQLLNKI